MADVAASHRSLGRIAVTCLGIAAGTLALAWCLGLGATSAWRRVGAPGPVDPADLLLLVVCAGGVLVGLWLGLSVTAAVLGALPGTPGAVARALARRGPAVSRRVASLLLGSTLVAAFGPGTAVADTGTPSGPWSGAPAPTATSVLPTPGFTPPPPAAAPLPGPGFHPAPAPTTVTRPQAAATPPGSAHGTGEELPGPGWSPTRPAPVRRDASLDVLHPSRNPARLPVLEGVAVRRGDTLWSIAARHLGPTATAAQIALEWPRWHASNRHVIGDDPDRLVPGQLLEPPSPNGGTP
ncbi:LysM peptidoglycan-binding domain-containing protein [Oryzihumus sp.]